jgi:membrane associated rhomboid family serine protease
MRRSSFEPRISMTVALLIINVVAFVVELTVAAQLPLGRIDDYFALSTEGMRHGYVWQLLTFQFMHAGVLHLLGNCLVIFFFGREVEQTLGRKRFLALYLSSGAVGGLLQALVGALAEHFLPPGSPWIVFSNPVVGASAGAMGLVAAYATLFPERSLSILVYFVIPVTMRAKFLLLFSALFTLAGIALPNFAAWKNVAHVAHLGGLLTGVFFIRDVMHWEWPKFNRVRDRAPRRLVRVPSQKSGLWGSDEGVVEEDLSADEFLRREVDPILDKISAHGIQSLTERERRILEAARAKMAKR